MKGEVEARHINAAFTKKDLPLFLHRRFHLNGNYLGLLKSSGVFLCHGLVKNNSCTNCHHWWAYDGWRRVLFWRDDEVIGVEETDLVSRESAKAVFESWRCKDMRGVYELMRYSKACI